MDEKTVAPVTMEEYDLREQAHRHRMEQEKAKGDWQADVAKSHHRQARQETLKVVGIAFAGVILVLGLAGIIFLATSGPNEGAAREQEREDACIANGGGWVPNDLLATANVGLCVYPGERAS
jgi:hypothetical protein